MARLIGGDLPTYLLKFTGIQNSFIYPESISWVLTAREVQAGDKSSEQPPGSIYSRKFQKSSSPTQGQSRKVKVSVRSEAHSRKHIQCVLRYGGYSLVFTEVQARMVPQAPVIQNNCSERRLGRGNMEPVLQWAPVSSHIPASWLLHCNVRGVLTGSLSANQSAPEALGSCHQSLMTSWKLE